MRLLDDLKGIDPINVNADFLAYLRRYEKSYLKMILGDDYGNRIITDYLIQEAIVASDNNKAFRFVVARYSAWVLTQKKRK